MTTPTARRPTHAVFVLAYGTPAKLEDIEPYYTHIRGGRPPSPPALADLVERYRRVGGQTPLLAISQQVADAIQIWLDDLAPGACRVYLGMKHWHPFIGDVTRQMLDDGITHVTAVVLAPHYSRYSLEGYRKYIKQALAADGRTLELDFIESWHNNPHYHDLMLERIAAARTQLPADVRDDALVLFSAHSLPEKIVALGDPYPDYLRDSARAIATRGGIDRWDFCYQSAGQTGEPWLGPDILDKLETLHAQGTRAVVSVPFGFVAEHLEVLWDIDTEAQDKAGELGMALTRIQMPNADAAFVAVVADVIASAAGPWRS